MFQHFIQHLRVMFPRRQNLFSLNVFMSGRMKMEFVLEEITCAAICCLYSLIKILYLLNLYKSARPAGNKDMTISGVSADN